LLVATFAIAEQSTRNLEKRPVSACASNWRKCKSAPHKLFAMHHLWLAKRLLPKQQVRATGVTALLLM